MSYASIFERSPMRIFERSIHGGLSDGELGAVVGRAGVGKSALLVHLALDRLLRDEKVLHISLREGADHVRRYYTEIFDVITRVARFKGADRERALVQVEKGRQIQCYVDRKFGAEDLERSLKFTSEIMHFQPDLVLIDGFETADASELSALAELARTQGFAVWIGARQGSNGQMVEHEDQFTIVVGLEPVDTIIELRAHKVHGDQAPSAMGLQLDPNTMLISGEDTWDPFSAPPSPKPEDCTLYSGGAAGAEALFGEAAERWGLREMNFTFDGHKQARTRGAYELDERELQAGDVSLVYVSKRLNRNYTEAAMIRRVLQSLWHQVSRAQQVFVLGVIQADGTVTGGTGWSVELARMWHKDLWVFDQDKESWFHWTGERWVTGVPVIEGLHICGSGSRTVTDAGARAIASLFDRSFGTGPR